ncbi:MAG: hypothetical protein NXH78_03375 [Hyphomonadaceae bacterium]|nr:hypothetical protein [Hyphomonadaceae bacterium]
MIRFLTAAVGLSVVLMGCQSNEMDPAEQRAKMLAMKPAIDSVPNSALGPQELLAGECGLFLWSQTDVSKFIFYSKALSGNALFAQDNVPIALTQTGAGGDIFGQFNTQMTYLSDDGREVSLTLDAGDLLDGGQRIESGLINIRDREGWDTKLPVLGVRACQQE